MTKEMNGKGYVFWAILGIVVVAILAIPFFIGKDFTSSTGRVIDREVGSGEGFVYNDIDPVPCPVEGCGDDGSDGGGGCTHDCTLGQYRCNGDYSEQCGYFDGDACLDFGAGDYCPSDGDVCSVQTGQCVSEDSICMSRLLKGNIVAGSVQMDEFDVTSGTWGNVLCQITGSGGNCADLFDISNVNYEGQSMTLSFSSSEKSWNRIYNSDESYKVIPILPGAEWKVYGAEGNLLNSYPRNAKVAVFGNGDTNIHNNNLQVNYQITASSSSSLAYQTGKVFYYSRCPPDPNVICGDGIINGNEQCDDHNTNNGDGCSSFCQPEFCGDGVIQSGLGEQCDDNNNVNGDGCSEICQIEIPVGYCGDGILQSGLGEQCDDGNTNQNDRCNNICQIQRMACVSNSCGWVVGSGADSCSVMYSSCNTGTNGGKLRPVVPVIQTE